MTIHEIKTRTEETEPEFFNRKTMKSLNQTMKSFKVKKLNQYEYLIKAKRISINAYTGRRKKEGYTQRIFDTRNNELKNVNS
jgi:hypothetical protein